MPLLTEKEARTKWCPMTRTGAYTDRGAVQAVTVNRDPRDEAQEACACLASDCAMWRWHGPRHRDRLGFCGLAGAPLPGTED